MPGTEEQTIVVLGATGLQGGAVARRLLSEGWQVRAVTRNPDAPKAKELAILGAHVVRADMNERQSLAPVFRDAYGVFSVQNPVISGTEQEIQQGKNVADVAQEAGIQHLVYGSAGTGQKGTGIPSWESKLEIEAYMKSLGLPLTILRPMAFMELMTAPKFFPAVSTWHAMPSLMGGDTRVPWLSTADLAVVVARAFAEPDDFAGREIRLAGDVQSIDQARQIYRAVRGKNPARFPMPLWMYQRYGFIGKDTSAMWRWLRANPIDIDLDTTRRLHPQVHTVRSWLQSQS